MPISLNPILPVIAAQGAAPELVLQPGTVVDAQVIKLLADNLVRIAISSLSIDVLSEVPLAAGQSLQLAVSQTPDGVRLAVVGQGAAAGSPSLDAVTLAPAALADVAATSPPNASPPGTVLTPAEKIAVSVATQIAATKQGSLAPLFANLGVVAGSKGLPQGLQQAVMQVLAQQTSLDRNLSGNEVKSAFQKSGLFLEASLASGTVSAAAGMPDLKAALIVLRQTLSSSLGVTGPSVLPPAAPATDAAAMPQATTPMPDAAALPHTATIAPLAPTLSPEAEIREVLLPQARLPIAVDLSQSPSAGRIVLTATPFDARPLMATTGGAVLNLLQEALQDTPRGMVNASPAPAIPADPRSGDVTVHTNTPPPPFRGALPSAQPVAAPSISPGAPLATSAHHLLADTDAAIARQTLLQVASLPDRVDTPGLRLDTAAPRWNFEIPFVTPQGTAMAQFEIAQDGGGRETEAAKQAWRARFSIDVEPAGPVHALISLAGDTTSVRMWAERPATAAQLRAGAGELSQALSRAELQPGDIVIRDGTPPQPAPAPAGHFLDRAL
jgi:hypothetical protein